MRTATVASFALLLPLLVPAAARAQTHEAVELTDGGCDGTLYRDTTLRTLLALDLADGGASLVREAPPDVRVTLHSDACDASSGTLAIRIARGSLVRERAIHLDGHDARSRARVAALVIAELVLATRELQASPEAEEPVTGAPSGTVETLLRDVVGTDAPETDALMAQSLLDGAPPEDGTDGEFRGASEGAPNGTASDAVTAPEPSLAEEPSEAWLLQATTAAGAVVYPMAETGLGTLRLGVRLTAPPRLPWLFEASIRAATGRGVADGTRGVHQLTGQFVALVIARTTPIEFGGGVEVDVGMTAIDRANATGDSSVEPTLTLSARGSLYGRVVRTIALTIDVRVGWVMLGVEAVREPRVPLGTSGPAVGLEFGMGFGL